MFGSLEGLFGGVSLSLELPIQEINVRTTQGEEKHPKNYFRTNTSHQESLFKESYPVVPSIFCVPTSVGLMGRPSSLAKVRWMALALLPESSKASCNGHHDHTGHWNQHSWLSWPYWPSKPTFMAIVTVLAIKTDIHGYRDRTGLEINIHLSGI